MWLNDVICVCLLLEQKSLCIVDDKNAVGNWKQKASLYSDAIGAFYFIGIQSELIHNKVKCLRLPPALTD